jgi:hypothetical protein
MLRSFLHTIASRLLDAAIAQGVDVSAMNGRKAIVDFEGEMQSVGKSQEEKSSR